MVKSVSRLHKNWLAFVVGGSRPGTLDISLFRTFGGVKPSGLPRGFCLASGYG